MTRRGVLQWRGLEGGYWALVTDQEEFVLKGEVPRALSGRDVIVEGDADDGFNFFMAGPTLQVRSVRAA